MLLTEEKMIYRSDCIAAIDEEIFQNEQSVQYYLREEKDYEYRKSMPPSPPSKGLVDQQIQTKLRKKNRTKSVDTHKKGSDEKKMQQGTISQHARDSSEEPPQKKAFIHMDPDAYQDTDLTQSLASIDTSGKGGRNPRRRGKNFKARSQCGCGPGGDCTIF